MRTNGVARLAVSRQKVGWVEPKGYGSVAGARLDPFVPELN
jgi:hypothetical protein